MRADTLVAAAGTLLLGTVVVLHFLQPGPATDLAAEGGLPARVASALLLGAAVVATQLAQEHPLRARLLAGLLLLLAVDELLSLHEPANRALRDLTGREFWLQGGWLLVLALLFVSAAVALWPLLRSFATRARNWLLAAVTLGTTGSVLVEAASKQWVRHVGHEDSTYQNISAVEELVEMTAMVALLAALVARWRQRSGDHA